jgi:hypothetical protein
MDPVSLLIVALILGSGGKSGTDGTGAKGLVTRAHIATPAELVTRATQPGAMLWAPYFVDVGELPAVADALARWAGLESGGDPTIISVLDERGLLQAGKQTVSEGGMSGQDWSDYAASSTMPNQVARISVDYATWLFNRAAKHLSIHDPGSMIPTDRVWFAYQYHQRPADFTQWGQLPPDAASASAYLLGRGHTNNDAQLVKRVTASNVVAWGTPDSPIAPMA